MVTKRVLIIAVLATFCLTATLFMVVPTRSQTGGYDPRYDVNGDGKIDMADISTEVEAFMSSGDPTLPVNITGHATQLIKVAEYGMINVSSSWGSSRILVDGYAKFSVNVYYMGYNGPNEYKLYKVDNYTCGINFLVDDVINFSSVLVKTYDVTNKYVLIMILNDGDLPVPMYVDIYLIA